MQNIKNCVDNATYKISLNDNQKDRLIEIAKSLLVETYITDKFLIQSNDNRLLSADISINLFKKQDAGRSAVEYIWNYLLNTRSRENHPYPTGIFGQFLEQHFLLKWCPIFCIPDMPNAMALARHHGMPSRLLDWSTDPMVAVYFSVANKFGSDPCIFALDKGYISTYCEKILFYDRLPRQGLDFLHLQKGLFTYMNAAEGFYFQEGFWPTVDKYLEITFLDVNGIAVPKKNYLKKIIYRGDCEELRRRLDRARINKPTLMPTFDNVASSCFCTKID